MTKELTYPLLIHPENFDAVWFGHKRFEYRRLDEKIEVGTTLELIEVTKENEEQTGRRMLVEVTHLQKGNVYGIPSEYMILSIRKCRHGI